jgi:hypothetical protein
MHNNGTTPQLILPDRRLLSPSQPEQGIEIQLTPHGIGFLVRVGDQRLPLLLDAQKATQLGVTLISVAAIFQNTEQMAKQSPNARPDGSESTAPPNIVIPDSLRD